MYHWLQQPEPLPPVVSLDQLSFLPGLGLVRAQTSSLPPVANKVLVESDTGNYATNSEAEFAAAMSLVKAGHSASEIISLFEQYTPPHFASKKHPAQWLQRHLLPTAFDYTESNPDADYLETWAQSRPWPGRTGMTDRRVFLALCLRARLEPRRHFRASVREVAELASVTRNTAERSLRRLMRNNFVIWAGSDKKSSANLYAFGEVVPVA